MIDQSQIEDAVSDILRAIGEDPQREGLRETPRRVARMYAEFFQGLEEDPAQHLKTGFEEGFHGVVILRDMPFFSICEHHLLPFFGQAHVGYIPAGRVVGASKMGRALDALAHRPQIQERLTNQLADVIHTVLEPRGVYVVLSAEHTCMTLRGVRKPGSRIVTAASRGGLRSLQELRQELLDLLGGVG